MFIFLYTVFRNSSISDEHVFCVALHFTIGLLIPFFSNVDLSDPALLNNQTELQKIIFSYAWPLMLFSLIELIPQLSLQIRRLRDAGFHPAWVLLSYIGLIPFLALFTLIGSIVLLIMSCQPTKPAPETQFDKVE